MKKILLLICLLASFAGYAQTTTFGGIGLRVNDSTTYQTNAAGAHSAGYYDMYFNNQATNDHWDFWNGASFTHVFGFVGTGNFVLSTSPTLTTPDLGTPSAAILTNASGYPTETESLAGIAEVATSAEMTTGTADDKNVTPLKLTEWAKYKMIVLGSDDTNNNGTGNTLEDVGGLSFAVVTGGVYYFRFVIDYTSAATTTGCRWTVNGPAATRLNYDVRFPTTATAESIQFGLTSLDGGTVSGQTVTSGKATVEGFYTAAGDGTFVLRFSSEVAGSAVIAKAGSICLYARLN